jgi:hypothetical protein
MKTRSVPSVYLGEPRIAANVFGYCLHSLPLFGVTFQTAYAQECAQRGTSTLLEAPVSAAICGRLSLREN